MIFQAPDGGWKVARAVGICDTCQACGCGEQQELIEVPGMVIQVARSGGFSFSALRGMAKAALGK